MRNDDLLRCSADIMVFVAVHLGAGKHAKQSRPQYHRLVDQACQIGLKCLELKKSALDAVEAMVVRLEEDPGTNAGRGSNLNISGEVEMDAAVMDSHSGRWAAVGAVNMVEHPVRVAAEMSRQQEKGSLSHGRIPPCLLVGNGARKWAQERQLCGDPMNLVVPACKKAWKSWSKRVEKTTTTTNEELEGVHDTVGAICVDDQGNIAVASSTGGIALKQDGRVGPVGQLGAAIWAEDGIGVVCSGSGEFIMRSLLAKSVAESLRESRLNSVPPQAVKEVFDTEFLSLNRTNLKKVAGVLVFVRGELIWCFNTANFVFGWSAGDPDLVDFEFADGKEGVLNVSGSRVSSMSSKR